MDNEMNNTEMENEIDFGPDIITLSDEDGQEFEFEVIDELEDGDSNYLALIPVFDDPQEAVEDDGELVILKTVEEDGETMFEPIQEEEEFNRISKIFVERLEEDYDIHD